MVIFWNFRKKDTFMEKLNFGDEPNSHIIGKVNFGGGGEAFWTGGRYY